MLLLEKIYNLNGAKKRAVLTDRCDEINIGMSIKSGLIKNII